MGTGSHFGHAFGLVMGTSFFGSSHNGKRHPLVREYSTAAVILLVLALTSGSCSVRFVSDYDEKLDSAVTDLHTQIDAFLFRMGAESGTPAGEYGNNQEFYVDTQAAISSIRMRAESSPKNDITVKQIGNLEATFKELQELHLREGKAGLKPVLIQPIRSAFDTECRAITAFELAKKRGQ